MDGDDFKLWYDIPVHPNRSSTSILMRKSVFLPIKPLHLYFLEHILSAQCSTTLPHSKVLYPLFTLCHCLSITSSVLPSSFAFYLHVFTFSLLEFPFSCTQTLSVRQFDRFSAFKQTPFLQIIMVYLFEFIFTSSTEPPAPGRLSPLHTLKPAQQDEVFLVKAFIAVSNGS